MHTKTLVVVVLGIWMLGISADVRGQQMFRRSQFMTNPYLTNPAIAGTLPETPISMSYRNQWTGFEGAPETITLSGHTALPNKLGIGGIVYSDKTGGAIEQTGFELTGSYTIDLNNYDAVSFGLSLMANQWSFDNASLDVWDVQDPALQWGMEKSTTLDAHFGLMVFSDAYSFGFAIPHLLQSSTGLEASPAGGQENISVRHYRFMGTYRYKVTDDFLLEPAGIVRLTERTPAQLDVYLRGWYNQMAWLSFGYRTNDALILGIGGEYGPFSLSYAYDVTSTGAQYFSPHSHEMTLTYFVPRSSGFNSKSMGNRRILGRNRLVK